MKKAVAFLVALFLFLGTVIGCHFWFDNKLNFHNPKFGTWIDENKFFSHDAITANLDKNSIVVFGSSELKHMINTRYHPEKMFAGKDINTMLIGAGYYQSLFHAIALSAIEPGMEQKKVVLIVSPQWFRAKGVIPNAYASRFSEDNFIAMLENKNLSLETKKYLIHRTKSLLVNDTATLQRVDLYDKILMKHEESWKDRVYFKMYTGFLKEKANVSIVTKAYLNGLKHSPKLKESSTPIDWQRYLDRAAIDGAKRTESNSFYIKDKYFNWHIKPQLEKRKNSGIHSSYCSSPEYKDLKMFLEVCKELDVKPLIVSVPVNGWWYDYSGFPKEDRQKYYENIREIAREYDAQLADFSKDEYTPYFLEDTIHLGWKGWVDVNESIYNFAKENK